MSTNYYIRKKPTIEKINNLKSLIDTTINGENYYDVVNMVNEMYSMSDCYEADANVLHLGKRSSGWKFLWCPNIIKHNRSYMDNGTYVSKYEYEHRYPLTKQGLIDFIMQDEYVVVDEYGEVQDKVEFLEMAFNWCRDGRDSEMDSDQYLNFTNDQDKFKQLGYTFKTSYQSDFENDGLRWTVFDDFC